jgi:capsular exopolysaccharide synthesis family protein
MNYQLQSPGYAIAPTVGQPAPPDLTLADIAKAIRKRWKVIFTTFGCFLLLGILACVIMRPRYEATEVVQIQKDSSGPLGLETEIGEGAVPADAIDYNITLQTQAGILTSDGLAVKAVEDLGLEKNTDFQPKFSPVGWVLGFISPRGVADPVAVPLHDAPQRRARAIRIFSSHLKVKVTEGTRLISIKYNNPDPKVARAVVNNLVNSLTEYNFQSHFAATTQAAKWLEGQLTDLKTAAETSQARVVQLQKDADVFTTGDTDLMGHVMSVSVVLSRLQDLNTALSTAQTNRILKEAVYRSVQGEGPESISGLAGNLMNGASPDVVNSLNVIQSLRTQEAGIRSTYANESARYGPDFPHIQQLQAQMSDLEKSIKEETARIQSRAKSDYNISVRTEEDTRALYEKQKAQAAALNGKTIDYTVAKQEADQNRGLYNNLYRRLKEAGAIAGLRSSNVLVMDPGATPGKPKSPNVPIYLAASGMAGLFFGSLLALYTDSKDNSLTEISQVERDLGILPLAVLPTYASSRQMRQSDTKYLGLPESDGASARFPDSLKDLNQCYVEALRKLRTAVLLPQTGAPPRVLMITSCQPGVGKTSLTLTFAASLAQQGHKVLVVECNMRRLAMQHLLGLSASSGLSTVLTDSRIPTPIHPVPDAPGVSVLSAGPASEFSTELLGSGRMKALIDNLRKEYDFVLLDAPPALAVADPLVLLNVSDMVLLVVRYGHTSRQSMALAYRTIASAAAGKPIGVVINGVRDKSRALYDYYGYKLSHSGGENRRGATNA